MVSMHDFPLRIGMSLALGLIWTSAALPDGGLFAPPVHYPAGDSPYSVAIGDLDGDQVAGQPESRRYRARYRDDDDPVGEWSDIVEVTAQG